MIDPTNLEILAIAVYESTARSHVRRKGDPVIDPTNLEILAIAVYESTARSHAANLGASPSALEPWAKLRPGERLLYRLEAVDLTRECFAQMADE